VITVIEAIFETNKGFCMLADPISKTHFLTVAHDYVPIPTWLNTKKLDPDEEVSLKDLIESCKRFNVNLAVHGRGKTFDNTIFKLENILDYCINHTDEDDIIIYLDAYDTVLLSNQTEIISKFKIFDKKIVFCSHYICEPYEPIMDHFPRLDEDLPRFLNSGSMIGYSKYVQEGIEDIFGEYELVKKIYGNMLAMSDQFHWSLYYLKHKDLIGIDSRCNIFQELSGIGYSSLYWSHGRWINQKTGTKPCILHGTGLNGIKKLKVLLRTMGNESKNNTKESTSRNNN
jgi:hypothetical protein